jgi:hypothetical protein
MPSLVGSLIKMKSGMTLDESILTECCAVLAIAIALQQPDVGNAIYRDYLPAALKSGEFKAKPEPKVVGHGLESIQSGFEVQKKGVSASKVVVTL